MSVTRFRLAIMVSNNTLVMLAHVRTTQRDDTRPNINTHIWLMFSLTMRLWYKLDLIFDFGSCSGTA